MRPWVACLALAACSSGVPGGRDTTVAPPLDMGNASSGDMYQAAPADLAGRADDAGGAGDLSSAAADLSPAPDLARCGTYPGDPCCASDVCPGVEGSGIRLVCMNHSEAEGVVDKRCMQYASSACGSFTQTCCDVNGQPRSLGDYCSMTAGSSGNILYCLNGTCKS
jgi:hypothetical protein